MKRDLLVFLRFIVLIVLMCVLLPDLHSLQK
jgi:hypothetical protein